MSFSQNYIGEKTKQGFLTRFDRCAVLAVRERSTSSVRAGYRATFLPTAGSATTSKVKPTVQRIFGQCGISLPFYARLRFHKAWYLPSIADP